MLVATTDTEKLKPYLSTTEVVKVNHSYYWCLLFDGFFNGRSRLPHYMGLSKTEYERLRSQFAPSHEPEPVMDQMRQRLTLDVFSDLVLSREEERDDLFCLLLAHLDKEVAHGREMAKAIAAGCIAPNHLWETLGLPEREALSQIIALYFPKLFVKNNLNMRWKRFFYKQLCDQDGDYVCKAPNCLQCRSFKTCFADESA